MITATPGEAPGAGMASESWFANRSEVKFQPASTQIYLGSPSLVRLGNGDLLASHDYFGPEAPRTDGGESQSTIYRSSDNGQRWQKVTDIYGAFWSSLHVHRGSVYLLGTSRGYGSIVIRRSDDDGQMWTEPVDAKSGLLFEGGTGNESPNYHCAPMPILVRDGRLYRAFEDCTPPQWGTGFRSLVISAPEDADLLDAANWRMSNKLAYDPAWTPTSWGTLDRPGWLEGNVVETPEGQVWNILRFNSTPLVDKAAIVVVDDEGRRESFDPSTGFIDFPGGMTKFTIRRDPVTGLYLALSNNNTDPRYPSQRNLLALNRSKDLIHWEHVVTLLKDDQGLAYGDSVRLTGFQYVDWHFDGDDIIYLVRTAYLGAHNFHDANRITFHSVADFRDLL